MAFPHPEYEPASSGKQQTQGQTLRSDDAIVISRTHGNTSGSAAAPQLPLTSAEADGSSDAPKGGPSGSAAAPGPDPAPAAAEAAPGAPSSLAQPQAQPQPSPRNVREALAALRRPPKKITRRRARRKASSPDARSPNASSPNASPPKADQDPGSSTAPGPGDGEAVAEGTPKEAAQRRRAKPRGAPPANAPERRNSTRQEKEPHREPGGHAPESDRIGTLHAARQRIPDDKEKAHVPDDMEEAHVPEDRDVPGSLSPPAPPESLPQVTWPLNPAQLHAELAALAFSLAGSEEEEEEPCAWTPVTSVRPLGLAQAPAQRTAGASKRPPDDEGQDLAPAVGASATVMPLLHAPPGGASSGLPRSPESGNLLPGKALQDKGLRVHQGLVTARSPGLQEPGDHAPADWAKARGRSQQEGGALPAASSACEGQTGFDPPSEASRKQQSGGAFPVAEWVCTRNWNKRTMRDGGDASELPDADVERERLLESVVLSSRSTNTAARSRASDTRRGPLPEPDGQSRTTGQPMKTGQSTTTGQPVPAVSSVVRVPPTLALHSDAVVCLPSNTALRRHVRANAVALVQAHERDDEVAVGFLTEQLGRMASPQGCFNQRLASHFLRAVLLMREAKGAQQGGISAPAKPMQFPSFINRKNIEEHFSHIGWDAFAQAANTDTLAQRLKGYSKIHIILLPETSVISWRALFSQLANQPGGLPAVRLTHIRFMVTPQQMDQPCCYHGLECALHRAARAARVTLVHHTVLVTADAFNPAMVAVRGDEAVGVVSCWSLSFFPDRQAASFDPRNAVLKWVSSLCPKVFVITESDSDFNSGDSSCRLQSLMNQRLPVMEAWDSVTANTDIRSLHSFFLLNHILDSVPHVGARRLIRNERSEQWSERLRGTGFAQIPFSRGAWQKMSALGSSRTCLSVTEKDGVVKLRCNGTPSLFSSAWVQEF